MGYRDSNKRNRQYPTGPDHPRWKGGERSKVCPHCKVRFDWSGQPHQTWLKQIFCSKPCADKGGLRHSGENHPNYKADGRKRTLRGKHSAWARAVLSRDKATCQHCGISGVELHAHHVKLFADFPDLRWEVSNGLTLCYKCHWNLHTALTANGVNSGNISPGNAGDNPEPSFGRKPVEGVTTSGRAYRRWEGTCDNCKCFITKRWSDAKGKKHLYCSKSCRSKHGAFLQYHGSNTATSALHESDDIV